MSVVVMPGDEPRGEAVLVRPGGIDLFKLEPEVPQPEVRSKPPAADDGRVALTK